MFQFIKNAATKIKNFCIRFRCNKKLAAESTVFTTLRFLVISGAVTFWVSTNLKAKFATLPYLPLALAILHFIDAPLLFYQKNREYGKNKIRKACEFPIFATFKLADIAYMGAIQAFFRENETIQYYSGLGLGAINGINGLTILGDSIYRNVQESRRDPRPCKLCNLFKRILSPLLYSGGVAIMIINPVCLAFKASNLGLGIATLVNGTITISLLTKDFFSDTCKNSEKAYQRLPTHEPELSVSPSLAPASTFFSPKPSDTLEQMQTSNPIEIKIDSKLDGHPKQSDSVTPSVTIPPPLQLEFRS